MRVIVLLQEDRTPDNLDAIDVVHYFDGELRTCLPRQWIRRPDATAQPQLAGSYGPWTYLGTLPCV